MTGECFITQNVHAKMQDCGQFFQKNAGCYTPWEPPRREWAAAFVPQPML